MLERFRLEHSISDKEHEQTVTGLGWTMKEYELGVKKLLPVDTSERAVGVGLAVGEGEEGGSGEAIKARALYLSDEYSPGGDQVCQLTSLTNPTNPNPYPTNPNPYPNPTN